MDGTGKKRSDAGFSVDDLGADWAGATGMSAIVSFFMPFELLFTHAESSIDK